MEPHSPGLQSFVRHVHEERRVGLAVGLAQCSRILKGGLGALICLRFLGVLGFRV